MSPDAALRLVTLTAMAGGLLLPPLLVHLLLRRSASRRVHFASVALVLAASFYVVFFRLFPDTLRGLSGPPVTIEVVLPDQYHGFLYLFFDSEQSPLMPSSPNVYTLFVPKSGRLRAGQFPGQDSGDKVFFAVHYLNGEPAPVVEASRTGGNQSKDGKSVVYVRPFIGTLEEFEAAKKDAAAELQVLEEMRRVAKSPPALPTPGSLEGIDRVPGF